MLEHSEVIPVLRGMSYENYDDARSQLIDAGLLIDGELRVGGARSQRCKVEGRGREKRGWYWLHEASIDGRYYLIGAYGVYEGNDPGTQKIKLTKRCDGCHREVAFKEKKCPHCQAKLTARDLSDEQRAAHRARIAEDEKKEKARRQAEADRAARRADRAWQRCSPDGSCDYLTRKRITGSHGARYSARGNLVIPMMDPIGRVHGLQVIYGDPKIKQRKGRDKDYWPAGVEKAGHFYMVGTPGPVILLCEGFATMCSILEATITLPVVMAFDANNLAPVARVLHKRWPRSKILICADDDYATRIQFGDDGQPIMNPGVELARLAALQVGGAVVIPTFALDTARADIAAQVDFKAEDYKAQVGRVLAGRPKLTDFNDLHVTEGLHLVGVQINAAMDGLGWCVPMSVGRAVEQGEGGKKLKPVTSTAELFDRFAIIYGHNEALFDFHERMLVSLKDMKLACSGREIWRDWLESREKKIVRIENVGFDPTEQDTLVTCNLWGGWPTTPREGECTELLALLEYICSYEANSKGIYEWLLKWLAYPIVNPGAKMRTALVVHGPQQVGKNYFFETVMGIYGEYGQVINQDAIEDKYNDCFSKKLYLIADEVVARQEMRHVKNKLKGMITGNSIRINPKNVKSYWEKNHCNIIFLSNEIQPLMLERDDARHVVLWTPPRLSADFYAKVKAEVEAGGQEALHWHLKNNIDLTGFDRFTPPPMTEAKRDLMDLGMDSTERFYLQWSVGKTDPVPFLPARSRQLHRFYREWCSASGYRSSAPEPQFVAEITRRFGAKKKTSRFTKGSVPAQASFIFPPGIDQPTELTENQWLTRCVDEITTGISAWREDEECT